MAKTALIGIEPRELPWLRVLVALLRHPDPGVPELARQALLYLVDGAGQRELTASRMPKSDKLTDSRQCS
jgi:hypothetical protein